LGFFADWYGLGLIIGFIIGFVSIVKSKDLDRKLVLILASYFWIFFAPFPIF